MALYIHTHRHRARGCGVRVGDLKDVSRLAPEQQEEIRKAVVANRAA
jgi:hypothetical protein